MILQAVDLARLLLVYFMHSFILIILFYLVFKILKRNYNRSSLILSAYYIFPGLSFLLNLIYLPLSTTIAGYMIYFILAFLMLFGQIFIVIFIINLLYIDINFWLKRQNLIISAYAIINLLVLIIPGSITFNEGVPAYSWVFLTFIYIIFTLGTVIPTITFSIKLFNTFEDKTLKRKFKFFIIGVIGMCFAFYGLMLYNTWSDSIFRTIWSFLVFFIVIPSILLIYYGIGQNL